MGCCGSSLGEADPNLVAANARIDQQLKVEKSKKSNEVTFLLLGTGESGKSTIFKQMKIIHQNGYTRQELLDFVPILHQNVLNGIKAIIGASEHLCIPMNPANRERAAHIMAAETLDAALGREIAVLWRDDGIQQTFLRAGDYQLCDAAGYCLREVERLSQPDFLPTQQDVLHARVRTTGMVSTEFDYGGLHFKMIDVGGQRNERKKWIHCFQDVTAILFCVSLNEYDQKLVEDESTNRMKESLVLFNEICNSKWFPSTSIILFLNKTDLFKEKIKRVDLRCLFPDYTGGPDFYRASKFIMERFLFLNQCPKQIYPHLTQATDTGNIQYVFNAVKDIILQNNLRDAYEF